MLKVTALGSNTQSASGAASGVADYLLGKADDAERAAAQLLSPVSGTTQQGRYYADSIEGPGHWLGHGAARLSLRGVVEREAFERVLEGRDPATGARLLSARGSAGRTALKVGAHTRIGASGEVLYGMEDAASALGLRPEDISALIDAGRTAAGRVGGNEYLDAVEVDGDAYVTDAELVRWESAQRELATAERVRADGRPDDTMNLEDAARRIGVTPEYLRRVATWTVEHRAEIDEALEQGGLPQRQWLDTVAGAEPAPEPFKPPFELDGPAFTAAEAARHLGLAHSRNVYPLIHAGAVPATAVAIERRDGTTGTRWMVGRADLAAAMAERHGPAQQRNGGSKRRFVTREALAQFLERRKPPAVRVGFDLTFTVQKSVSVLGLLTDGDHQDTVVEAFDAANAVAIDWLEHNAAYTRRNGQRIPTEGLVVGSFLHGTSRAMDPFLHRHNVVANAAIDRNGHQKTLDGTALYRQAHAADAIATAELRYRLSKELGVEWVRSPPSTWEVDGIGEAVIAEFSTRRHEITEALAELSDAPDARQRDLAAVRSRSDKTPATRDELIEGWRRRAARHGLDAAGLEACLGRTVRLHDRLDDTTQADLWAWLEGDQGVTAEHSTFTRRDVIIAIADYPGRDGRGVLMPAGEIVRQADTWLASAEVATVVAEGTARRTDRITRADGRTMRTNHGDVTYTTVSALQRQQELLALANAPAEGRGQVPTATLDAALAAAPTLTNEQAEMVRAFTRSGRPVQAGVGLAGAGKTFTMRVAAHAWADAGYRVLGACLAGQAAQVLTAETGIEAETIAMLLTRWRTTGENPCDTRTVLIIDEAATVDDRSFLALLTMADQAGATVRCIGDPYQHESVAAGGAFRVMCEAPDTPALTVTRRITHDGDRAAGELLREGRPREALAVLADHGHLFESRTEADAYRLALALWWQDRNDGITAPLVERTNSVREQLNRGARLLRQRAGEVATDREIVAANGRAFSIGDEVVARVADRSLHGERRSDYVANGSPGVVVDIDSDRREIVVDFAERGIHRLGPSFYDPNPRGPDRTVTAGLDLRYAITSHGVQGATFERIVSVLRSGATLAEAYVNITRGRDANRVVAVARTEDPDHESFLPTIDDDRTARDQIAGSIDRDEPDEMALSIDPIAAQVAALRASYTLPELQAQLDQHDDPPAALHRAVNELRAAVGRTAIANPDPKLTAAFGPRPDVPWLRDQWESTIRDIAAYRAARPGPPAAGPWSWALDAPTSLAAAAERSEVLDAIAATVWTLTARRLADQAVAPDHETTTPLRDQPTHTVEEREPPATPADVAASTRAAEHTARAVRDAARRLEQTQTRQRPGLRRDRSAVADARIALEQAEAAHRAARALRERTIAREQEARLDAGRAHAGLPSGPAAQARAETVRNRTLTDPPSWLRSTALAAAAAGAGTALASEHFARWAGDVAIYADMHPNPDPTDEHPLALPAPPGPLATERQRLRDSAPVPLAPAHRPPQAAPRPQVTPR